MHTPDELLSTAEAAELAGRDRSTITRWVQAGRLIPAHRSPAGIMLFRRADLEALRDEATS